MSFKDEPVDRILVPVDGSEPSWRAAERAVYIAKVNHAEVTFLSVVDLNQELSALEQVSMSGYVPSELKEGAYQLLNEIAHEVPSEIHIKTKVEIGTPAEVIVDEVEEEDYDLLVIGSRGFSTLRGLLMGSVSQYVLQHANCPVLVVR